MLDEWLCKNKLLLENSSIFSAPLKNNTDSRRRIKTDVKEIGKKTN